MLERIQNSATEALLQNSTISSISALGANQAYEVEDENCFIDECDISLQAIEKLQKELDIKNFSDILMNTDEKESNSLVISQGLSGLISFDSEDILESLLNNKNLFNDVVNE